MMNDWERPFSRYSAQGGRQDNKKAVKRQEEFLVFHGLFVPFVFLPPGTYRGLAATKARCFFTKVFCSP